MNWSNVPGKGQGFECNLGYLAMAVSLMLTGAGPLSIDALRGGKWTDLDAG
jgi:uncharacterized membrane protein YphA (DoxX/SURF4 family)